MPIPKELIDAIAVRVAEIILDRLADRPGTLNRLADEARGSETGTWMRSAEVAHYLGWSRKSVYRRVARMEMPHYKVDGILLFKREEVDAWLEQFREEPREQEASHVLAGARRRTPSTRVVARRSIAADDSNDESPKTSQSPAPRELPPPLGGDEQRRDEWARQLEITREELDEMRPSDFGKAWDKRNERLREGGVFEYVTELSDAYGWDVIEKMTASELIRAVADLGLTPWATKPELVDARK